MDYLVEFSRRAEFDLARLDRTVEQRIRSKISAMAASAGTWPHEALAGQYRGQFRLRVGNYRVRYALDRANCQIDILRVQHRSVSYRNR